MHFFTVALSLSFVEARVYLMSVELEIMAAFILVISHYLLDFYAISLYANFD